MRGLEHSGASGASVCWFARTVQVYTACSYAAIIAAFETFATLTTFAHLKCQSIGFGGARANDWHALCFGQTSMFLKGSRQPALWRREQILNPCRVDSLDAALDD